MTTKSSIATLSALAMAALLTACSGNTGAPEAPAPAATSAPAPETTQPEKGTRENPYSPGEPFTITDWEIALGETDPDATPEINAEELKLYDGDESYLSEPEPSHVFITVPVKATYNGTESDDPAFALNYAYVSADGNAYADLVVFVGAPNDLSEKGELYPGGKATGNVLQMVEVGDVAGGAWRVTENSMESTAGEVFVAGAP